ncbi:CDGSH iron-sulfur domain-containing protein 3, mitochondrial-like [Pocillopora damicornis]|uniref:CDGSH iron-sulfur domain-containing protein 3, mitochondrial-like n=1 Tax=Pocillopora damicornis TaxID=46731 RepID=UPI000F550D7C|nr:CDGSH iron-sulfur domain-containing protein 3, mitochondrial-like [Pocillopora damicornis]
MLNEWAWMGLFEVPDHAYKSSQLAASLDYFVLIMALFLRNPRLLTNQRFCLQLQQVFHYCDATVIAAKEPFQVELVEGKKYSWCKCGLSKKQPFCDGRHKVTQIKPVRFVAEVTSSEIFLCGCKQTGSPPFCDGTHATEKVQCANL